MTYNFDSLKVKNEIVKWIQSYFLKNGPNSKAIVAISGGADSSVVAALCVEALGPENVYGFILPDGSQHDIQVAKDLCSHLKIYSKEINIEPFTTKMKSEIMNSLPINLNEKINESRVEINTPARIRASLIYSISDAIGGRVANTSNFSEDFIGYNTKYGDTVGDFSPLMNLTKTEVIQIGAALELPSLFYLKTPEDGLTGKTDEEKLGFSYKTLDDYILYGKLPDSKTKDKIDDMHSYASHKILPPVVFNY